MQIGKGSQWTMAWNDQVWSSGGQISRSHEAEISHKSPFRQDLLKTIRRILTNRGWRTYTANAHCVATTASARMTKSVTTAIIPQKMASVLPRR